MLTSSESDALIASGMLMHCVIYGDSSSCVTNIKGGPGSWCSRCLARMLGRELERSRTEVESLNEVIQSEVRRN